MENRNCASLIEAALRPMLPDFDVRIMYTVHTKREIGGRMAILELHIVHALFEDAAIDVLGYIANAINEQWQETVEDYGED